MVAPPFLAPTQEPKTYVGVCRCKANKYTIDLHKLTGTMKCNCSICRVHDLCWIFGPPDMVKVERQGLETVYEWGNKTYTFNFCATCGNLVRGFMKSSCGLAINARLLQDVDIWKLQAEPFYDGKKLPPTFEAPKFAGPAFDTDAQSMYKIYYGNCHCKAVTIGVRSKPLPAVEVAECNCAYCWKSARVHFYPKPEDVHIGGADNLQADDKSIAGGSVGYFCKTCCVPMLQAARNPGAKDAEGKQIPDAKEALGHDLHVLAVNARVLHDVEWDQLHKQRVNRRDDEPQFVVG